MAQRNEPFVTFGTDKAVCEMFVTEGAKGPKYDIRAGRVFHKPGGEEGRTTFLYPDEDSIKTLFEAVAAAHAHFVERRLVSQGWSASDAKRQTREQLPDWILEHIDGRAAVIYSGSTH